MGKIRGQLQNVVVKTGSVSTAQGTRTVAAFPIDLDSVTTGQRPTWCKIIVACGKTGTTALANITITPKTGTSVTCNTDMAAYPVSVPVADDVTHGAVIIGGTAETGRFQAVYDIDLMNSQVRTWIGASVVLTATTDVVNMAILFVFGGFQELPATNTAQATMA
jgi:hypothetical protein